jgi:hypothetical protein
MFGNFFRNCFLFLDPLENHRADDLDDDSSHSVLVAPGFSYYNTLNDSFILQLSLDVLLRLKCSNGH